MVEIGGAECADNSPGTVQQAEQTSSSAVRVVIVKSASAHLELFPVYSLADPSRRTGSHGVVLAVRQIGHAVTGDVQHTGRQERREWLRAIHAVCGLTSTRTP